MSSRVINLKGRTFGTLKVTRRSRRTSRPNGGRVYWWTRCVKCGAEYEVRTDNLRRGAVTCRCQGPTCLKPRKVEPGEIGARYVDAQGYVRIFVPWHPDADAQGWMLEHRYVMEGMIGRRLRPEEVVHHVDHDRSNNERENLTLFENQEAHKLHEIEEANEPCPTF